MVGVELEIVMLFIHYAFIHVCSFLVEHKLDDEGRPFLGLRLKIDATVVLLYNLLRDHESKTNTFGVHLFRVCHESKELKKLIVVLLFDSNP